MIFAEKPKSLDVGVARATWGEVGPQGRIMIHGRHYGASGITFDRGNRKSNAPVGDLADRSGTRM